MKISARFCTNAMVAALVATTPLVSPATAMAAEPQVSQAPPAFVSMDVDLLANPATVITLRGTQVPFGNLVTGTVRQSFGGVFCEDPNVCIDAPYNAWVFANDVNGALSSLNEVVMFANGYKIILGYSQGAMMAELAMEDWVSNGTGPFLDDTLVVLYGNPYNDNGGGDTAERGFTPLENPYNVLDITTEYDIVSDKPKSGNLLATLNSWAALFQHTSYRNVDLDNPDILVKVVDGHTYAIIPTKSLPLLGLVGKLFPSLNARVKAIVDQAYDRDGFERLGDRDILELAANAPQYSGVAPQNQSRMAVQTQMVATEPEDTSDGDDAAAEPQQRRTQQNEQKEMKQKTAPLVVDPEELDVTPSDDDEMMSGPVAATNEGSKNDDVEQDTSVTDAEEEVKRDLEESVDDAEEADEKPATAEKDEATDKKVDTTLMSSSASEKRRLDRNHDKTQKEEKSDSSSESVSKRDDDE